MLDFEDFEGIIKCILCLSKLIKECIKNVRRFKHWNLDKKLRLGLRAIRFSEDGLLKPLGEYIESGDKTVMQKLNHRLRSSSTNAFGARDSLESMEDRLAEKNVDFQGELNLIISSKFGPNGIRSLLESFAKYVVESDKPEGILKLEAVELRSKMREFNNDVNCFLKQLEEQQPANNRS